MAQGTTGALLPVAWGTTVNIVSGPVLPANPSRNGLIFVNNSASVAISICPVALNAGVFGVYTGFAASTAIINGAGSITMQAGDKFIIDNLNCTCAWNGIASGAGGQLTILES